MLLEKVVISESEIYTCTYVRMYNSLYMHINHIYICNTTCVFLHALKVPHIVYHNLHRKKYTLVMKKVHEQVAKFS